MGMSPPCGTHHTIVALTCTCVNVNVRLCVLETLISQNKQRGKKSHLTSLHHDVTLRENLAARADLLDPHPLQGCTGQHATPPGTGHMASATREPASAIRTLPSPACSVACDMCASRFAAHAYSFRSFWYLTPRRSHLDLDVLILLSPWLRLLRPPVAVRAENGMALSTATRLGSFFQGAAPFLCPPRIALVSCAALPPNRISSPSSCATLPHSRCRSPPRARALRQRSYAWAPACRARPPPPPAAASWGPSWQPWQGVR